MWLHRPPTTHQVHPSVPRWPGHIASHIVHPGQPPVFDQSTRRPHCHHRSHKDRNRCGQPLVNPLCLTGQTKAGTVNTGARSAAPKEASTWPGGGAPYRVVRCRGVRPAAVMRCVMASGGSSWPYPAPGVWMEGVGRGGEQHVWLDRVRKGVGWGETAYGRETLAHASKAP
jgi:hypothetical protein